MRYFLVVYTAKKEFVDGWSIGRCSSITNNGKYVDITYLENELKEKESFSACCITNIIELSERDFKDAFNK